MRRKELIVHVANVIDDLWGDGNEDVATAVLDDEAFGALAHTLNNISGGDEDGITESLEATVQQLSDEELDFIAGDPDDPNAPQADSPAAFLTSKAREVCG